MRVPRINLPTPVLLFIAGIFVGSFFTLKFSTRNIPEALPPLQEGVLGKSIVQETASEISEAQETQEAYTTPAPQGVNEASRATIARVIDGDTVELEDGSRLRYIGIDAPEVSSTGREECLAEAATAANVSLVEGKEVAVKTDVSDKDRYGRSLRYVYAGELFVNATLVEQGLARAYPYPPDTKFQREFARAETRARAGRLGMWGSVCGEPPAAEGETASVQSNAGILPGACEIKGNIAATGEKIYHIPRCRSYEKTVINAQDGERWFCTAQDAESAGWRKAKDCP